MLRTKMPKKGWKVYPYLYVVKTKLTMSMHGNENRKKSDME